MSERWITIELVEDEMLRCNSCRRNLRYDERYKDKVYLYVNVDNEIEEIMCNLCWQKKQKREGE